jgi:carboxymethylenebutenolidase
MKTRDRWSELRIATIMIAGIPLLGVAGFAAMHGQQDGAVYETRPKLPATANARHVLSTTPRHIEWVAAPLGANRILAFVVSPERSDRAPVVIVTAHNEGASDWARAVADQVAEAGFIAVVPDELSGEGPRSGDTDSFRNVGALRSALARLGPQEFSLRIRAVRLFALASPASNGIGARLDIHRNEGFISAAVQAGAVAPPGRFALSDEGFAAALAFIRKATSDHPVFSAQPVPNEHAMHMALLAKAANKTGEIGQPGRPGGHTSYYQKRPDLPADFYTAKATLAHSKLRQQFVDIPVGDVKLHTWIEFPAAGGKVGTVVVMQHGAGMDDWVRAVADQLAQSGFLAIAPDVWSGTGPGGGALDSFRFVDDAMKASAKVTPDETIRRFKVARDYALKLPQANGKSASLGFCAGGGNSFRFAGEVPELNGAVVFYGGPPEDGVMARINSPVIGFYGENDVRVTAAVEPTAAKMKTLGKSYEPHIYPKTTHSFLLFQEVGGNPAAVKDAWPRAIAFLKKQLASN